VEKNLDLQLRQKNTEDALKAAELIDLTNMNRGKHFKIIADIMVNNEDFVDRLVEKGYAVKIKKNPHNWCKQSGAC
jgi:micrococcal nuclease